MLRIKFYFHRLIAKNMLSNEITSLREQFCELPGSMLDKLKYLHSDTARKAKYSGPNSLEYGPADAAYTAMF